MARGGKPDEIHRSHEDDRAVDLVEQFEAERSRAKDALALSRAYQERNYNKGKLLTEFEEGDLVVINLHSLEMLKAQSGRGRKLLTRYDGPFEISRKISPVTYQLRLPAKYRINPVINIIHLEKYNASPPEFGDRPRKHIRAEDIEDLVQEVEIERIVAEKMFRGAGKHKRVRKYKVRFKGFLLMRMSGKLNRSSRTRHTSSRHGSITGPHSSSQHRG